MHNLTSILEECIECRICVEECPFLSKLNKTPKEIANELIKGIDLTKSYVMECFLCNLCRAVCPLSLDFASIISHARHKLSATQNMIGLCYRLFLPDDPLFMIDAYKQYKRLNYQPLGKRNFKYAFFPGCAMSIYSPEATMQVYEKLTGKIGDVGLLDLCCGKPLEDIGLSERASKWLLKLEESLREHNCVCIITACPNCYYYLRSRLQDKFKLLTVYEVLENEIKRGLSNCNFKVTVHDSCPDRFKGIFATHVRGFFRNNQIVEMKHCKEKALCCGAGGLVSCADHNLPAIASEIRAKEFFETNVELMVVYCYTCAQMFWASQPEIKTKHILDLALKTQDMSEEVKSQELSKFAMKLLTSLAPKTDS